MKTTHKRLLEIPEGSRIKMKGVYTKDARVGNVVKNFHNQKMRDCLIVKVGRTRVRLEYRVNSGKQKGTWVPILDAPERIEYLRQLRESL